MTTSPTPKSRKKRGAAQSLAARIKKETDPELRNWFLQIAARREKMQNKKFRPFIACEVTKEDARGQRKIFIYRQQDVPTPLKGVLQSAKKKTGPFTQTDLHWLRVAWRLTVGDEIAADTNVYAFKNGVLTISVSSSALLQEIKQFHADAILASMRDIWQITTYLLCIKYIPGKRENIEPQ